MPQGPLNILFFRRWYLIRPLLFLVLAQQGELYPAFSLSHLYAEELKQVFDLTEYEATDKYR